MFTRDMRVYILMVILFKWAYTDDDAYLGCFYDGYNALTNTPDPHLRVLALARLQSPDMTIGRCINHCVDLQDDIQYAGVETGNECYCGTADADYDQGGLGKRPDEECRKEPCVGNENQACGDDFKIAVYNLSVIRCQLPEMHTFLNSEDFVSVQNLITFKCLREYTLVGTPSVQCIFDDSITDTRWERELPICTPRSSDDDAYLGCFYDAYIAPSGPINANLRVLPLGRLQSPDMTIGRCINHCVDLQDDIQYAGVETGNQCYCGTADADYDQGGLGKRPDEECRKEPCVGNENQACGDDFKIAVYNLSLIRCQLPEIHTFLNSEDFVSVQNFITFKCLREYTLEGPPSVQCIFDDSITDTRWERELPICTPRSSAALTVTTTEEQTLLATSYGINMANNGSGGAIAGAVIGGCGLVILIIIFVVLIIVRKRRETSHTSNSTKRNENINSDEYLDLDPASRIKETEYQGIYTNPVSNNNASSRDAEYQEVLHNQTDGITSRRVPVPPPVKGITDSGSYYKNVKQNKPLK
ncbi:uncharacterized protein [Amphiura filiformis]|uniref:uncharacterized protein n=1 Tax=Amphiura filiformis TaxID=82378 RepID=UPI003B211229